MRKIPTLFVRDPADLRLVTREVHPDCGWVLDGEGVPTRKYDGTCVLLDEDGEWWARREVKPGRPAPAGYVVVETDPNTVKTVGWEPLARSAFAMFWVQARTGQFKAGTYELCGPKVNGNPEGYDRHTLVSHDDAEMFDAVPLNFDGLRDWLLGHSYEGIVWHHPDGRMAKLKRRDFPANR
jgi:hypothetical protein